MSQPPGNFPQAGDPQGAPAPQAPPAGETLPAAPPPADPPFSAPPTAAQPPAAPPFAAPPFAAPPFGAPPPGDYPGYAAPPPARHRGVLITSIVLGVVLVLCGAGGTTAYFLIKKVGGSGKASPTAAVEGFLGAVFTDHDVEAANRFVCSESRNKATLSKKINDLRSYEQKYRAPRYTWPEPTVDSKKPDTATLTVPVTITTEDDRVATKKLRFVTVNESGWWVCEVRDAG